MLTLIGSIFKYSLLVLTVLILSHIVEVKGVTVSQHVKNGMNWVTGFNPTHEIGHVSREISNTVTSSVKSTMSSANEHFHKNDQALDSDITPQDQKQLNHVIQNGQHKR